MLTSLVQVCPVCQRWMPLRDLNAHLDECLKNPPATTSTPSPAQTTTSSCSSSSSTAAVAPAAVSVSVSVAVAETAKKPKTKSAATEAATSPPGSSCVAVHRRDDDDGFGDAVVLGPPRASAEKPRVHGSAGVPGSGVAKAGGFASSRGRGTGGAKKLLDSRGQQATTRRRPLEKSTEDLLSEFEADAEVVERSSPFEIFCPYPSCGQPMEASDWIMHALEAHSRLPQMMPCPICALLSRTTGVKVPEPSQKIVNLAIHLIRDHSDLIYAQLGCDQTTVTESTAQHNKPAEPEKEYQVVSYNETPGSFHAGKDEECSICLLPFEASQTLITMECLCVFHKKCILEWFTHSKHQTCPNHPQY
ncbi:hypothetical protein Pelo_14165 [Pelomyxa schiedti]|nr:hypothetical protein Pelo_14165 [Pelomyxa schiedti]